MQIESELVLSGVEMVPVLVGLGLGWSGVSVCGLRFLDPTASPNNLVLLLPLLGISTYLLRSWKHPEILLCCLRSLWHGKCGK